MRPQDLIAAFETLAEAPEGVARLRELVLKLAVRGRLVPQDPDDEPASVLLERIAKEKARLVKEGKIRKPKSLSAVLEREVPFMIPEGWAPVRLGQLGAFVSGKTPSKSKSSYWTGGVPWVSPKDMKTQMISSSQDEVSSNAIDDGLILIPPRSVLVVVRSGILRHSVPVAINLVPCTINQDLKALILCPSASPAYVMLLIRGFEDFILKRLTKTGTTVESMRFDEFSEQAFILPPLAEQRRIVAKVDELMSLIDRLEAAQNTREGTRTALRDAALAALQDADTPEEVDVAWERIAERMDDLFTDPADVEPLRQTVLQLAVHGRLVPQDPNDEPASVLLGGRTLMSGSSKQTLPDGWSWATIVKLGKVRGGGTPSKKNTDFWDGSIPWVSPKDMKRDFIGESQDYITDAAVEASSVKRIPAGSLLMVVRGMILAHSFPIALTTAEVTINQDIKALLPFDKRLAPYLLLMMKGLRTEVLSIVKRSTHGTCKLLTDELFTMPVPIPPLSEQRRIVVKVDELMGLLERLEERLVSMTAAHDAFAAAAVDHLDA